VEKGNIMKGELVLSILYACMELSHELSLIVLMYVNSKIKEET
jgi:hypothetical protein